MQITPQQIVQLYEQRKADRGEEIDKMLRVQRNYDGDVIIPMPEMDEREKPGVANLISQGIDQLGMRISSRLPDVAFPPFSQSAADMKRSSDCRKAVLAWWDMNNMPIKFARRARYMVGYGCSPVILRAAGEQSKRKMPHWQVLNPLCTFPAMTGDPDCVTPPDIIYLFKRNFSWLQSHYPMQMSVLQKGQNCTANTQFDLLWYLDDAEEVLLVRGRQDNQREMRGQPMMSMVQELARTENRIGVCPGVVPGRITLSKLSGHFTNLVDLFMTQAKLTAYEQIAISRSIFPDEWVISHPNNPNEPRIVQIADGRQGVMGEIENGQIQVINSQPSPQVPQAIDRLERAMRVQGSIPADWGGESATNIRTALRGQQVASSAVDPTIQEAQAIFAMSMAAEDERAIAISKAYWGGRSFSFYIPTSGISTADDYRPNSLFQSDFHVVKFSAPGVDAAGIPIELGQRTGTGEMSMQTAREIDPMIEDPELEQQRVTIEGLNQAMLKGLEAQAAQAQLDPHELALIMQKLRTSDMTLEEAVLDAQEQLQKQQAALQQANPGSPETMPGMGQAPPPGAPSGGPPQLAQILSQLRQNANLSPAELGLQGGAPPTGQMPPNVPTPQPQG